MAFGLVFGEREKKPSPIPRAKTIPGHRAECRPREKRLLGNSGSGAIDFGADYEARVYRRCGPTRSTLLTSPGVCNDFPKNEAKSASDDETGDEERLKRGLLPQRRTDAAAPTERKDLPKNLLSPSPARYLQCRPRASSHLLTSASRLLLITNIRNTRRTGINHPEIMRRARLISLAAQNNSNPGQNYSARRARSANCGA